MPEWDAEIDVDEALVLALLADQVPALAVRDVRPFAKGWDNAIWLVNGELAFRFPRRAIAIPGVEREIDLLPRLAARLPLPIPEPAHVGRPSERFPWPFFGSRLLPGRELAGTPLVGAGRQAYGAALGSFLAALHAPDVVDELGPDLPVDFNRRADMDVRVPRTRDRLATLVAAGLWSPPGRVGELLDEAAALGPADGRAIVHGDLHVRHVLVDDAGVPSAIIDWGDVCVADPAVDFRCTGACWIRLGGRHSAPHTG